MVATRSSQDSTSPSNESKNNKRAGEKLSSPIAKRGKNVEKPAEKGQLTIEETMRHTGDEEVPEEVSNASNGAEMNAEPTEEDALKKREEAVKKREDAVLEKEKTNDSSENVAIKDDEEMKAPNGSQDNQKSADIPVKNAFDEVKADTNKTKQAAEKEQDEKSTEINKNDESIIEDEQRDKIIPSSILEKGIIYFFFRGRVGVEEPQGIEDVARSYIVLRPLPLGAKIGSGPLQDTGNARLLVLPKKMLPKSTKDRFLTFVEKTPVSIKDLREQFAGTEYATKTVGTSHVPAATPFAEGIYAITNTGANSHLAYHITIPSEIGEIQKELGLFEKGSYNISLKNPEAPSPSYATIANPAKYTKEIQEQFRGRRWMPVIPEALNFEGAQFLLIGEGLGDVEKAVEVLKTDEKHEKEKPEEELEKLEEEDHERVEGLKEDDPVFADLGLSSKGYPHLQTTW